MFNERHCSSAVSAWKHSERTGEVMDKSSSPSDNSKENQCCPSSQGNEAKVTPDLKKETSSNSEEEATELPQCKMGCKIVDDMSFMISCTNWY
ncbi:hypothetical protein C0J50_20869 [Silurus asotus]|uniref:Uncharacterized protein n=1 Tax=Silurus asotus TaxID=30991 RepID=A0AAD5ANG2_SILAS|nr:hypothetical protein C0J50_20869 [Silurus asotus]